MLINSLAVAHMIHVRWLRLVDPMPSAAPEVRNLCALAQLDSPVSQGTGCQILPMGVWEPHRSALKKSLVRCSNTYLSHSTIPNLLISFLLQQVTPPALMSRHVCDSSASPHASRTGSAHLESAASLEAASRSASMMPTAWQESSVRRSPRPQTHPVPPPVTVSACQAAAAIPTVRLVRSASLMIMVGKSVQMAVTSTMTVAWAPPASMPHVRIPATASRTSVDQMQSARSWVMQQPASALRGWRSLTPPMWLVCQREWTLRRSSA